MYFYIFIVIYLTGSLSNAFLFTFPPLDPTFYENTETIKLNIICINNLKIIYDENKNCEEGMDINRFKELFRVFELVHRFSIEVIEKLFTEGLENNDKEIKIDKFVIQMEKVVKIIEKRLCKHYLTFLNQERKMTTKELLNAIIFTDMEVTEERVTELITDEYANAQDISFKAFRNILAKLYHEVIDDYKNMQIENQEQQERDIIDLNINDLNIDDSG
ncbi:uncharacterized protein LOC126896826 isoform X3 [Daktulosphaira vitifoliae]|uniref:uncharacterized protein LOC126896826 isoform X2 n=1 Tax=Daktulosphaira vitifoliae TaxID=58002 RepID=UPI0021A9AB7D|nr:uncharacterized protein LOC126896826 isoform X2 [Daktulosphaira vitifoliae]XP_050525912.1 uncharacterized protein LOC126896826 isoform X3 [Daktulosphaira vitifoliae]